MLRIGIEMRAALGPKTGDRTYLLGLVHGLAELGTRHEIILYLDRGPGEELMPCPFEVRVVPSASGRLWKQRVLPRVARAHGIDVLHVQYIPPRCRSPRVVTTIHDVTYRLFPQWFTLKDRWLLHHGIRRALPKVAAVITGSECTRRDLQRVYGLPAERVFVTPYAAYPGLQAPSEEDVARVRGAHGLTAPYALFLGVLQPRKNVPRIVEAFRQARADAGLPHQLIVAGKRGWKSDEAVAAVDEAQRAGVARWLGYVRDEDVPGLLGGCDLFLFPTLYEGFGLPILEAFVCGAPVITSSVSSMPEVAGGAAELVDPSSVPSITEAIVRVLGDTAKREQLRQAGRLRATEFSWARTAELTTECYERVAGER